MQHFHGDSRDTNLPWVGIEHWTVGKILTCEMLWSFTTPTGTSFACKEIGKPFTDKHNNRFIIGHLSGIQRAINASMAGELRAGDIFTLRCIEAGGKPEFVIDIERS